MSNPYQPSLFNVPAGNNTDAELPLSPHNLRSWQERVLEHQLRQRNSPSPGQGQLFDLAPLQCLGQLPDPLHLPAQHLHFWRWPDPPQRGSALYFVFDHSLGVGLDLMLYLGETGCADRRWKGDHDCKAYLAAYGESLVRCGQRSHLSIRFWCDAPSDTRARRLLEQEQIRRWQPPFNKECRQRWQTPFQNS
jgi:hypothetical protein